jgi:hypothetical protein
MVVIMQKQILDLVKLQQQLDSSEIYEDEDGNKTQTIYLGSILDLTHSGKVYYPFAHSNVDCCPRCKGEGTIKNKHGKKKKYEKLLKKKRELFQNLNAEKDYFNRTEKQHKKLEKIVKQHEHWNPYILCNECYGLGSLEARLDQDWWKELEEELETINAYIDNSDDGCDIMISSSVEDGASL